MMKPLGRGRGALAAKMGISCASGIVFLALLEVGMRGAGFFISDRISKPLVFAKSPQGAVDFTILCMGDSFTHGGNVSPEVSYPYFLFQLLKSRMHGIRIINGGYCERPSWQTRDELNKLIPAYRPNAIILLSGAADHFNPSALRPDEETGLKRLFLQLRVYKMYRAIKLELKRRLIGRFLAGAGKAAGGDVDAFLAGFEHLKKKDELSRQGKHLQALKHAALAYRSTQGRLDSQCYENDEAATVCMVRLIAEGYFSRQRYDVGVKFILDALEACPWMLGKKDGTKFHYILLNMYMFQGVYDARYAEGRIERILLKHPELRRDKVLRSLREKFSGWKAFESGVDERRHENLEEIARLCRSHGVKLIIQNYPSGYTKANEALARVSRRHRLPFVDNQRAFKKLLVGGERGRYLEDDNHCAPEGYREMANNVHRTLESAGVLP